MKAIQVIPTPEMSTKVDALKKQLRTSRAGILAIALDFVVPRIESGEMELVNGRLQEKAKPEPASV